MIEDKYKILAFIGESGSGKDYAVAYLEQKYGFNRVIPWTTRPPREDDPYDKFHYIFTTIPEFTKEVMADRILEATCFNGNWYYGTHIDQLDINKVNVAVMNPEGLYLLRQDPRVVTKVYRVVTDPKERLIHILNRQDKPDCKEVCRRFLADEKQFQSYVFQNKIDVINNFTKDFEENLDSIAKVFV